MPPPSPITTSDTNSNNRNKADKATDKAAADKRAEHLAAISQIEREESRIHHELAEKRTERQILQTVLATLSPGEQPSSQGSEKKKEEGGENRKDGVNGVNGSNGDGVKM